MTQATIEVTRRRPGFIGLVSTFLVFIDGVNAGVARRVSMATKKSALLAMRTPHWWPPVVRILGHQKSAPLAEAST
jgi:hypothetical protein